MEEAATSLNTSPRLPWLNGITSVSLSVIVLWFCLKKQKTLTCKRRLRFHAPAALDSGYLVHLSAGEQTHANTIVVLRCYNMRKCLTSG